MFETGNIPENFYYAFGFPKYEVSVVIYYCNDVIESKWIQREKGLTHWFQQYLRLVRQKKQKDEMEKWEQDKKKAINDAIQLNEEADKK